MVRQALPVTPRILADILRYLDLASPKDSTFWCLCLFAFLAVARKSNLVPTRVDNFNPTRQLTRADVKVTPSCLFLRFTWTKTIQFGQRHLHLPLMAIPGSAFCPVRAYENMCRLVPGKQTQPAFMIWQGVKKVPYTYPRWQRRFKLLLKRSGRDHTKFSSHSFRRGGATFAFRAGVPAEAVKLMGDWRSDSYLQYLHIPMTTKTSAATQVSTRLANLSPLFQEDRRPTSSSSGIR